MSEKNEKKSMSFTKFLTQFNVVGLAIGIIMGSGADRSGGGGGARLFRNLRSPSA